MQGPIIGTVLLAGLNLVGQPVYINGTYLVAALDADGQPHILEVDASGNLAVSGSSFYDAFAKIWDQKAQNTDGGSFASGARRTRTLNTKSDDDSLVTLAANQFVLAAGSYYLEAKVPAYNCNRHRAWLRNMTGSVDTLIGTSEVTAGVLTGSCLIEGEFTITVATTFEIQHQCETTSNTLGLGVATNFDVEIYTVVKIWRKA